MWLIAVNEARLFLGLCVFPSVSGEGGAGGGGGGVFCCCCYCCFVVAVDGTVKYNFHRHLRLFLFLSVFFLFYGFYFVIFLYYKCMLFSLINCSL